MAVHLRRHYHLPHGNLGLYCPTGLADQHQGLLAQTARERAGTRAYEESWQGRWRASYVGWNQESAWEVAFLGLYSFLHVRTLIH